MDLADGRPACHQASLTADVELERGDNGSRLTTYLCSTSEPTQIPFLNDKDCPLAAQPEYDGSNNE